MTLRQKTTWNKNKKPGLRQVPPLERLGFLLFVPDPPRLAEALPGIAQGDDRCLFGLAERTSAKSAPFRATSSDRRLKSVPRIKN